MVALNTDASVKRLKGEGRPVNDLDSRAAVIGGLASVDRVTSFDDPTPIALIERLRPDILIKGSDYTREGVVGGDLVESWGGEVKLADFKVEVSILMPPTLMLSSPADRAVLATTPSCLSRARPTASAIKVPGSRFWSAHRST